LGLDILQFSVTRNAANFFISAVLDGVPGTTNSRYNVGVDRGAGTYHLGAGIRPDILFDSAINLQPATLSGQVTFIRPPDIITPFRQERSHLMATPIRQLCRSTSYPAWASIPMITNSTFGRVPP
jgi:hypothetical protein